MGILNLSPDSFYDGGKYSGTDTIEARIDQIISEGADIIDVGSVSTRPGSKKVSPEEEFGRLEPAMKILRKKYPDFPVSIDTSEPIIAERMIRDYDAGMINDITAGGESCRMYDIIAKYQIPYIIMHMQGTPENMQVNPRYKDVVNETLLFIAGRVRKLKSMGINDIIIDPGFGFGKTIDHNYDLLSKLESFKILNLPILVGISRKSMIYKILGTEASHALNGTTALNMVALMKGANLIRVHDVLEAVEICKLFSKLSHFSTS
jgi:dihydropteroate synthase